MPGTYQYDVEIKSNVAKLLSDMKQVQDRLDTVEGKEYKIKLNVDEKKLSNVISNLEKMLDSLGKGTGDFKQFENLSKELSSIVSEVQNLSKAFGKVDDSGAKTLLSSIQNIDKSLSELSQNILNVNKNMSNMGGNTSGAVKQVENITNESKKAASALEDVAKAQAKVNGQKTNISSGTKDAFPKTSENLEQVAQSEQKVQQEAVATDKALDNISFTPNTEGFDDIIAKFGILREQAEQINKIVKTTKQTADGTPDISYKATLKNGNSYYLGENSTPQVLNANETVYDAKIIAKNAEQEAKAIQAEWDKNLKSIQDYMNAVTKLNNLKAKDKGTGSQANQIALQTENVEKLKQAAWDARQNLSSMQAENPDIIAWKQWVDMMELFDQASKGSAESAAKLKDVLDNVKAPSLDKYENKLASYQTKKDGYNATIDRLKDGGWASEVYLKNVQDIENAVKKYNDLLNEIKAQGGIANEEDIQQLKEYESKIKETISTVQNMSAAEKGYDAVSGQKELDKIHKLLNENSKMSSKAKAQIKAFYKEIESGNPSMSLNKIHAEIMKIVNAEVEAGRGGKSMWSAIKEKAWYGAASAIGTYFGFNDIIQYGKEVASIVIDLNTQITELAKVSEQSSKQIYADFDSYADIAKEVRGTISDTIAATADWSKNGYSIPDAKQLAEVSQLYKNVGDGIDIDTANESLISTLKGFQLEADQAEHIVDVFNKVSNNEAISSGGIGEALQRSAASFNAANTSLEKSVALVTATNSVLQDPEKVGNMWKTKFYCLYVQKCA